MVSLETSAKVPYSQLIAKYHVLPVTGKSIKEALDAMPPAT